MPGQLTTRNPAQDAAAARATDAQGASRSVQMRRSLSGMGYAEQSAALSPSVQMKPAAAPAKPRQAMPEDFDKMWDAHPHNHQDDETQNTSSEDVLTQEGFEPDAYANTCAFRMSVMWNTMGGIYKITREKAAAAGIKPGRVVYSKKTKNFYILSAAEMWTFVSYWFGKPHQQYPASGRFKNAEEFRKAWDGGIKDAVAGKKGIVAFDKIFGYSGTGHVDLFNGEQLSDSSSWYDCQALKLWFV